MSFTITICQIVAGIIMVHVFLYSNFGRVFDMWPYSEAVPWGGGGSTPRKLHARTAHAKAIGDFAEYSAAAAAASWYRRRRRSCAQPLRCAYGW